MCYNSLMEKIEEQAPGASQGRNWTKLVWLALAAIPFAVKVAYLMKAWVTSPVDRIHIGLYGSLSLLFVVIAPAAVCAVLAVPGSIYWISRASQAFTGETVAAYAPAFAPGSQKGYLGREIEPSAAFERFFRTGEAHQFAYANTSNAVSVLADFLSRGRVDVKVS